MANRRATLPLKSHMGSAFTWTGNVGVCEASTLGRAWLSRVWDDACDEGFIVRGRKSDKVFAQHSEVRHGGEVVAFVFRAIDGSGVEVHVLND